MNTPANAPTGTATPCCAPGCCAPAPAAAAAIPVPAPAASSADAHALREQVREGYGQIARAGTCCAPGEASGGCCGPTTLTPQQIAAAIGYQDADLALTPDSSNLGLSCGNPAALASLRPGETVLDLGSGAGFDCFVAGPKVGASGRVIGVDMTPEMLGRARAGLATYQRHSGLDNIEFRLGEIEHLPVADASIDVVLSNCVLNLAPDKARVWREISRVLKPGGRVAISDLALLRPLPPALAGDLQALIGCIAGAQLVGDIERDAAGAGLQSVRVTPKSGYIRAMTESQDPLYVRAQRHLPPGTGPADFVTSVDITASKPG
jgi:arsenite methyltransferase